MQLSYRGINYQSISNCLPNIKTKAAGKYRGVFYQITEFTIESKPQSKLKYRGAYYQSSVSLERDIADKSAVFNSAMA